MARIKVVLVAFALVLASTCGWSGLALAAGSNVCDDPQIDKELKIAAGCPDAIGLDRDTTIMPAAVQVIEAVIAVIGILAAGILVYGGLNYVLGVGSPDKIRRAQNIVLYAAVGLVVAVLSFTIVYFVSQSIWGTTTP